MLGVLGIIFDKRKWLSIVTTVISGGLVAFWFAMIAISLAMTSGYMG